MAQALATAGVATVPRGALLTVDAAAGPGDGPDRDVHDLIRDTASDLGVGLVRLQVDHRRIEDVFSDD
jgi:ABC-2 type transport system ATP-binding protein